MITKEREYKATTYQVAGFSMLSPFGRFFLDPFTLFKESSGLNLFIYFAICVLLVFCGLILIEKGRDILRDEK